MTELKEKFIEALKSIDYNKLNIYELKTVSEIAQTVEGLDKTTYEDMFRTVANGFSDKKYEEPKKLSELKEV